MKSKCLDYRILPGQNKLMLSYLYQPEKVRRFYPHPVEDFDSLIQLSESTALRPKIHSHQFYSALQELHSKIGAGENSIRNLNRLKSKNAVAVLTGQQVGLYGGPALTVYKAITAIRLANDLSQRGIPAVPVFWMASQDSDFDEVRSTYFPSVTGELDLVRFPDPRKSTSQMAGTVPLDKSESVLDEAKRILNSYGGTEIGIDLLSESYGAGDFRTAFARYLLSLFDQDGLVVWDPLIQVDGTAQFYRIVVERREEILSALIERSEELEAAGFPVQVHVPKEETLLFLVDGQNRYKLDFLEGRYRAKGLKKAEFSPQELIREIESGSAVLSPSALLRPVLQDFLFPTLVTVGGPAEVAYFSQTNAISHHWKSEIPVLLRCGFTMADHKVRKYLKKWHLAEEEILNNPPDKLMEMVFRQGDIGEILRELEETRTCLEKRLFSLKGEIDGIDPTISSMLENSSKKIFYQMDKVRNRLIHNAGIRDSITTRHISYLTHHLRPQNGLQERVVNFTVFLERQGRDILKTLLTEAEPFRKTHKIIYL
jgi:bacillithiol biosynthesis cysteine-adding enzyme BshC